MVRRVLAGLTLAAVVVTTAVGCGKASPTKNDPPPAGGFKETQRDKDKGGPGAPTPPPPPPPPPP